MKPCAKLILRNFQSPGDIVMLTAAVRDLHAGHPGRFLTDVRTSCPDLWKHNPYLTPLRESQRGVRVVDCHYPLVHSSNRLPYHFIHGFMEFLSESLGVRIRPTAFRGDIHLSSYEKRSPSKVEEVAGADLPYWIVVSGGKYDYTTKWWDPERFQKVVDHFQGRVLFVQVGGAAHHQPRLRGTIDFVGKTTLRQAIQLVHHSQGVLTVVNLLMHLAAAVEPRRGRPRHRACVVVAGGREPPHWEAYPHHQFLHTVGALPCSERGGCWKARVAPLGDGDPKDKKLCVDPVAVNGGLLPHCLDMITARDVIRRIESYFDGGSLAYLSPKEARKARAALERQWK